MGNKYKWVESSTMSVDNTTPIYGVQFDKVDYNDANFMTNDGDFNLSIFVGGDILTVNVSIMSTLYNNMWNITYSEGGTEDIVIGFSTFHVVMGNNKYTIDFPAELVLMTEPSGDKTAVWCKVIDDSPSTEPEEPEEPEVPKKYKWVESSTMVADHATPIYGVQLENVDSNTADFMNNDGDFNLTIYVAGDTLQIDFSFSVGVGEKIITYSEGGTEDIVIGLSTFPVVMENNKYIMDFPVELVLMTEPSGDKTAVWYKVIDDSPSIEPEEPITIAENLQRIIQAKSAIKTAIESKGVTVGDITIDGYAEKINEIEQGGVGLIKLPSTLTFNGWDTTAKVSGDFDMGQWDWSAIKDWSYMFRNQNNLTSLINFPTNIQPFNMREMFTACSNLTLVDLSGIDTSKVTDMGYMFSNCNSLTSLDLSNWDTGNVTVLAFMFNSCSNLISIGDLSSWDTSNVTVMNSMFNGCSNLTSIDLSSWDTSKVTFMMSMFQQCSNLTEVRMGGDVSNLINATDMFYNVKTTGTFYYNPAYDYSKIIAQLPSTWTAVPME